MKLEDQCCSLELSKKLKELNIKQDSVFVWEYFNDNCYGIKYRPYAVVTTIENKLNLYSAFTVAELGEILPGGICQIDKINKKSDPDLKKYAVFLAGTNHMTKDENEANA